MDGKESDLVSRRILEHFFFFLGCRKAMSIDAELRRTAVKFD